VEVAAADLALDLALGRLAAAVVGRTTRAES
jgi:hypothetical protein